MRRRPRTDSALRWPADNRPCPSETSPRPPRDPPETQPRPSRTAPQAYFGAHQQLEFLGLYVVDQTDSGPFNRGVLLNIGFEAAVADGADYVVLHDVDEVSLCPRLLSSLYCHPSGLSLTRSPPSSCLPRPLAFPRPASMRC